MLAVIIMGVVDYPEDEYAEEVKKSKTKHEPKPRHIKGMFFSH